jgi:hypothetical protein
MRQHQQHAETLVLGIVGPFVIAGLVSIRWGVIAAEALVV